MSHAAIVCREYGLPAVVGTGRATAQIRTGQMIRVDGTGQFEINYDECAEALGWDDFGNDDFEEIMSTHYGRMVVLDDKIIMFANPEDAAEYIDFDLKPV